MMFKNKNENNENENENNQEGNEIIDENKNNEQSNDSSQNDNEINVNNTNTFKEAVEQRNQDANILKELNQSALQELEKAEDNTQSTFAPYAIVIGTIVSLSLLTYFMNRSKSTTKETKDDKNSDEQ